MKAEIKEKGVFDQEGKELEVGTVVSVKGDELPGWLVGKAVALSERKGKAVDMTVNPADPAPADADKDDTAGV